MMEKLHKLVKSKFAWVVTLLPGVNLLYVLLLGVFAPGYKFGRYATTGAIITAAALYFGHGVCPEGYFWLFVWGITILLSAISLYLARPWIGKSGALPRDAKRRLTVVILMVLLFSVIGFFLLNRPELKAQTQALLQSVVDSDQDAFYELADREELTLSAVQSQLKERQIVLEGEVTYCSTEEMSYDMTGGVGTTRARYRFTIGEQEYSVEVCYVQTRGRARFTELSIE